MLNHQGNKDGSAQWDSKTSWNGDPTNRTNSYIEYGGTGDQADYAIRKYARETTTPGLLMYILMCVGMFRKKSRHCLVLVVDWSGSMNENNRIGEVQKVNRFVDTLAIAVLPITSTWAMLATQVTVIITTPFKWGSLIQSKIQLKILRQVALEEELSLKSIKRCW